MNKVSFVRIILFEFKFEKNIIILTISNVYFLYYIYFYFISSLHSIYKTNN